MIRLAQSRLSWILISIGFTLMALRRLSEFVLYLQSPEQYQIADFNSLIDIFVSVIMIISLVYLTRILTSIKKTENERYESEIRFRTLFNNSSDELFLADIEGNFLEVNKEVTKKLGYTREELLKMNFADIKPPKYVNQVRENIDKIIKHGTHVYESEHVSKDKKNIALEMSSRTIRYKGEKVIFTIARDITERREFERKILSAVIEAEERERKRFAKEIHDGLGPLLYTIKIYLNEIYSDDISSEEKENLIKFTNEMLDDAVSNIRTISDNLMPTVITDYGLVKAIESLVKKINVTDKIKIEFTCKNCIAKLDIAIEMILYRITEELINNTLKHSTASMSEIVLDISNSKIILDYKDNGVGCIVNEELLDSKNGMGLKNIISRSKTINANYSFSNTMPNFHFNLEVEVK